MADVVLKISLQDRDIDSLKTKLQGLGNLPAAKVELDVKEAITKAHDLRTQLRDVSVAASQIKTPALSTVATGAKQAAIEARSLYSELKEIQIASARTTDPKIFTSLQTRAIEIEKDLDRIGTKLNRVASGRLSAAGISMPDAVGSPANAEKAGASIVKLGNQSANALKLTTFQMTNLSYQINDIGTMLAMGASPFQIIASQGGQIYQIFGSVNNMLAFTQASLAKVGLSLTGLGVMGGVAAVGYGVIQWSKSVREEAEKRLKAEEMIAGAMSRQALLGKQILADYEKQSQMQSRGQQFDQFMDGASVDALRRRLENLKALNRLGGNTDVVKNKDGTFEAVQSESSKTRIEEMLKLEAEINQRISAGSVSNDFNKRYDEWKKSIDSARKAEEEWQASIQKGIQKAEEVGKAWTSTLNGLATRVNDNPFTRVFMDARSEIDKLKEDLRGLPQDMQQAAIASQQAFNARQLFSAQVNSAMGVFELQETARRFRDDSAGRKNFGSGIYNRSVGEYQRMRALGYEGGGINEQANQEYFARRNKFLDNNFNGESASDRLDRQMQSLSRLNPADDAQRAILDRSILGFASSIDPSQLRGDQRDQIASIAERSAERQMRQEMEALNEMKRQTDLLARIETATKELKGVAQKSGNAGVDKAINVNVNAPAGTEVQVMPSQPGPATVDLAMGGPGGLSNT